MRRIFEAAPSPYLILAPDLTIVAVNAAYLRAATATREDIVGRPFLEVLPDNPAAPEAQGTAALDASLRRVLATRSSDTMPIQRYDSRRPPAQGGRFEARYWRPVNSPVLGDDGNVAYIIHHVEDVTDLIRPEAPSTGAPGDEALKARIRKLEAEMSVCRQEGSEAVHLLQESQERYGALIQASSEVLYRMSPDWSEMRQLQGGDFIADTDAPNRHWLQQYIHPDDQARVLEAIDNAIRSGSVLELEHRVRRADGTPGWTFSRAVPVRDATGEIVEWFGAARDITARKVAEESLQASEEKYRGLFANMAEAFALCELIYDAHGTAVDFRCLEASAAFYRETGLTKDVINRPAREYLPQLERHWLEVCEHVVRTGQSIRIQNHNADTQRFYDAIVFRPKPGCFATVFRDITDFKRTQSALQDSEHRLALALSASGSSVWEMEVATGIIRGEDKLYTMLGYAPGDLDTMADWFSLIHPEDAAGLSEMVANVIEGKAEKYGFEARLRAKSGEWRWNLCQAVAAGRDASGRALRLVGTHTDITERKLSEERIRDAALHDPLTGLPNRALVFEYGSHLLAGLKRTRTHGALLFIDLDRFKPVNDIYGHHIGDKVLQEVGKRLVECTRHEDLVGRLGGDEFVILLPHLDVDRRRAAIVAQNVLDSISRPYRFDSLELSLSPSIGVSYFPEHAPDMGALIHTADLAMYQAKHMGRSGFQFYTPELDRRAEEVYSLETRLRLAIERNQLVLHYQPVVDIATGCPSGAEALVRLADKGSALVGPAAFIPIAESCGLIGALGEWVVREACRQHGAWLDEGLQIPISINVSPLQFRRRDFVETLRGILTDTGVEPTCLQLEVTESTVMESLDEAIEILDRLKSLGIKVAIDDFGTGYSSLSRLSSLPLDKLKVDQSFVRCIESDPASRAVTEAIIVLGRRLHLDVIGKGVESERALRYLQQQGCNEAQGNWYSQPLPAPQFAHWHRRQQAIGSASPRAPPARRRRASR